VLIEDGFEGSSLPDRYKAAIRYVDTLILAPGTADDTLEAELATHFTPAEIVELTATVTVAMAFSKIAIAWGPPEDIPVLEVPTPTPDGSVSDPV
jgi:alkylhydroperoxidase family enzyme